MGHYYFTIKSVFTICMIFMLGYISLEAANDNFFATPIAMDDNYSTTEGVAVSGNLLDNDVNPDGGPLQMTIVPFPAPLNGSVFLTSSGTFSYTPNAGFSGVDQFGYRVCDNNNNCIIATARIYVWANGCTPTVETITENGCGSCVDVCIDTPLLEMDGNYAITQDGQPYGGNMMGCNFQDVNSYSYFDLLGQGASGPYEMISWTVDAMAYTGTFNDPQALVDLMNIHDPAGNWFLDENQMLILGGNATSTYSNIMVQNLAAANSFADLIVGTENVAMGTSFCMPTGMSNLEFNPLDGSCPERVVSIDVVCSNNAPIAVNDSYDVNEGESLMDNVMINDSEPDGDPMTTSLVTLPSNGAVMLGVDGSFTYAPSGGYVGADMFVYELCDDQGLCSQATANINVLDVNDPPIAVADSYTILMGETFNDNVLTNDTDPENDALTVTATSVSGPQFGILTLNTDGTFTYISSPTFSGTDQFVYELCDAANNCVEGTVTITINVPNDPPVANNDTYTVTENQALMDDVADNDTDESMSDISASLVSQPTNGAVTLNADGTFTYMPFAGYVGADAFTYEICDTGGLCDQATVNITVTSDCNTPVDAYTSPSCDSCVYTCLSIPFNYLDDYEITLDGVPFNGDLLACDFDTVVSYTYFTLLGQGDLGPYDLISWTVDGVDHAGSFNNPVELLALMNSIDPLGNWQMLPNTTVIYGGVDGVSYSTMMVENLAGNQSFSEINYNIGEIANGTAICVEQGLHTIEATLIGNACPSVVANVSNTCTGNLAPIAVDDNFSTMEDELITDEFLSNDTDPNGDLIVLNTSPIMDPVNGTVVVGSTGLFTYVPNTGFSGLDSFVYEICDGSDLCDQATVYIEVIPLACTPPTVVTNVIAEPYCGQPSGMVDISVTQGTGTYTYAWSDGGTADSRTDLLPGNYDITVTDTGNNCETILSINLTDTGNCNDTIYIDMLQGESLDTCLTDWYDLNTAVTSATVCYDNALTALIVENQTDACINLTANATFMGMDTLCIYHCNDAGYCDTTNIIVNVASICEPDFLGLGDEVYLQTDTCAGVARYCLPIPFGEIQNYTITDNGTSTSSVVAGCNFDTIITYNYFTLIGDGEFGPYELDSWTIDGQMYSGEFQTISDLVDSMNLWNPDGMWILDTAAELIIGGNGGTNYSDILIHHPLTNSDFDIGFNIGEYSNGTNVELVAGSHELVIMELTTGCTDTVQIEVFCIPELILYDTILVGDMESTCFMLPNSLPGNLDVNNIDNTCMDLSGTYAAFDAASQDGIEICLPYTGMETGTDTACITICDDLGFCQTTTVIVTVLPNALENIVDTLYVGETEVVCTDGFNYMANFDSMGNACADLGGASVIFDIDDAAGCVTYSAIEIGTDTACIVFCTDAGICDTAFMYIHVMDTTMTSAPIAVNDMDSTLQGMPIMIDVALNDTLNGTLQSIIIMENPIGGTTMVSGDSIVLYTPNPDFCGTDSLVYMVCNEAGCDTAMVIIEVECSEFEVFNGFSPNGDGVNDFFTINGMESMGPVTVTIFNRWGNVVYERENQVYTNFMDDQGKGPWDGTWNGQDLPDGTYFYCIEMPDGIGTKTGYIQIQR